MTMLARADAPFVAGGNNSGLLATVAVNSTYHESLNRTNSKERYDRLDSGDCHTVTFHVGSRAKALASNSMGYMLRRRFHRAESVQQAADVWIGDGQCYRWTTWSLPEWKERLGEDDYFFHPARDCSGPNSQLTRRWIKVRICAAPNRRWTASRYELWAMGIG